MIVLISCCAKKNNVVGTPEEVYCSPLFKLSMEYAKMIQPEKILILSAKYGVLSLDDIIHPYNETLSCKSKHDREEWYQAVMNSLDVEKDYLVLAGKLYYSGLNLNMEIPLGNLGIGMRLKALKESIENNAVLHVPTGFKQSRKYKM